MKVERRGVEGRSHDESTRVPTGGGGSNLAITYTFRLYIFHFLKIFSIKTEKWKWLLNCDKPLTLFITLPFYVFGIHVVFWVPLKTNLKNLKMIQKTFKKFLSLKGLKGLSVLCNYKRVIFSIESAYLRKGEGYLKSYRCLQGRGRVKIYGFYCVRILWMAH